MDRLTRTICLTLAALALLGFSIPAWAAQPAQNLTPFKASLTGPLTPRFVNPLEPAIQLGTYSADGQSDVLGAVNLVEANTLHVAADGSPFSVTDGVGVLTAANGDALFVHYSGPVTGLNPTTAEFTFTVSGGRGRFLGATGSGVIHCAIQADQKTFTRVIEGSVGIPK